MSQETHIAGQAVKQNILFYSLSGLLLCGMLVLLLTEPQQSLHLLLNSYHCEAMDTFFKYYTRIGEYGIYILFAGLLFYRLGDALFVLSGELGIGLIVQVVKHIAAAPRPATVFDIAHNLEALPLVEGVRMSWYNSFPSGHTATFVTLFLTLSILCCRRKNWSLSAKCCIQTVCFLCAFTGAYSRIYLSQHFLADVFAGACLSLVCVPFLYGAFSLLRISHPRFYDWRISLPRSRKR